MLSPFSTTRPSPISTTLRARLTFANTISLVALFVALGAVATPPSRYSRAYRRQQRPLRRPAQHDVHGRDITRTRSAAPTWRQRPPGPRPARQHPLRPGHQRIDPRHGPERRRRNQTLAAKAPASPRHRQATDRHHKLTHGDTKTVASLGPLHLEGQKAQRRRRRQQPPHRHPQTTEDTQLRRLLRRRPRPSITRIARNRVRRRRHQPRLRDRIPTQRRRPQRRRAHSASPSSASTSATPRATTASAGSRCWQRSFLTVTGRSVRGSPDHPSAPDCPTDCPMTAP